MGVTWEDPPPPRYRRWADTLDECRQHRGEWAKVGPWPRGRTVYKVVADLKNGKRGNVQVGEFEICSAKADDGTGWYVYLRCVAWPDLKAVEGWRQVEAQEVQR